MINSHEEVIQYIITNAPACIGDLVQGLTGLRRVDCWIYSNWEWLATYIEVSKVIREEDDFFGGPGRVVIQFNVLDFNWHATSLDAYFTMLMDLIKQ